MNKHAFKNVKFVLPQLVGFLTPPDQDIHRSFTGRQHQRMFKEAAICHTGDLVSTDLSAHTVSHSQSRARLQSKEHLPRHILVLIFSITHSLWSLYNQEHPLHKWHHTPSSLVQPFLTSWRKFYAPGVKAY